MFAGVGNTDKKEESSDSEDEKRKKKKKKEQGGDLLMGMEAAQPTPLAGGGSNMIDLLDFDAKPAP